ncbi:MAG: glycogen/starch synthase [Anaerolineales bacterium]
MALIQTAKPHNEQRTVVFVTFESEFAPLGGLAAVMRRLPRRMAALELEGAGACFTIAPYFEQIARYHKNADEIEPTGKSYSVRFDKVEHEVDLLRHVAADGFTTYLLDTEAFFNAPCDGSNPPSAAAPCNPYLNPAHPERLLQDALFFCAAVSKALVALGHTSDLFVCLQDWQTASAALTIKKEPGIASAVCTLTMHNPYDHPLSDEELAQIFWRTVEGPTVLTKMIPFTDGPLCTVSENFAAELTGDPLHTRVYAPHLQALLQERGVVGIDNGLFSPLDFPGEAIAAAQRGEVAPIIEEKARRREELIEVLHAYQPEAAWGALADLESFDGPFFLCFGRDDPRQKGYDVVAAAIRQLPPGRAKFIFTPIPGDEGLAGLGFLQALAEERAGDVKVFPFRMARGFLELMRGSTYLVMASLYEPFGAATEGYAKGTPVVARATGGLVQQVAPYPSGVMGRTVRRIADRYHARGAAPTGFLFREPDLVWEDILAGWEHIVACEYDPGDRVAERAGVPLFDALVCEAAWAFQDATDLYMEDRRAYAEMIAAGAEMLRQFSWDRAVRSYQRIFNALGV